MLEYILLSGRWLLVFGCRYWLPVKATDNRKPTTYNQTPSTYHYIFLFIDILFLNNQTTSFVWKTIPSEARVTRDAVSGLKQRRGELSGRQYLAGVCSSHFLYILVLSSRQFFFVILYIPRLRPGLLSLRSVLASSQSYLQPTTPNQ